MAAGCSALGREGRPAAAAAAWRRRWRLWSADGRRLPRSPAAVRSCAVRGLTAAEGTASSNQSRARPSAGSGVLQLTLSTRLRTAQLVRKPQPGPCQRICPPTSWSSLQASQPGPLRSDPSLIGCSRPPERAPPHAPTPAVRARPLPAAHHPQQCQQPVAMAALVRAAPVATAAAAASAAARRPRCAPAAATAPRPAMGPAGLRGSSLRGVPLAPRLAAAAAPAGRRQVAVAASWGRGNGQPDIADRVVGSLPYLMPLLVRGGGMDIVRSGKPGLALDAPAPRSSSRPFHVRARCAQP